jgi:signal transduction histidine kinase
MRIMLKVRDNGRGIPREKLQRYKGSLSAIGIGLAGMRERVYELQGSLAIESGSRGTTLTATIPLRQSSISHGSAKTAQHKKALVV